MSTSRLIAKGLKAGFKTKNRHSTRFRLILQCCLRAVEKTEGFKVTQGLSSGPDLTLKAILSVLGGYFNLKEQI
jgi:hypothetical protein